MAEQENEKREFLKYLAVVIMVALVYFLDKCDADITLDKDKIQAPGPQGDDGDDPNAELESHPEEGTVNDELAPTPEETINPLEEIAATRADLVDPAATRTTANGNAVNFNF